MIMSNLFLYIITCLIWGSTWLAIHFQVQFASPIWSVSYRFLFASILLFVICISTRVNLRFSWRMHAFMLSQGIMMFSLSYICFYIATDHMVSGLVAMLSALTLVFNIINARLFLGTRIGWEVILGCILGVVGLILIFAPDLSSKANDTLLTSSGMLGIIFTLLGTLIGSFGSILSKHLQNRALPVLQSNAFGMLYGAICSGVVAMLLGETMTFSFNPMYLGSLAYLSIFGSVIAFSCYIKLIGIMGPERVGYVSVVTPLLAMLLSTFFEGFDWAWYDYVGIALALLGNILILRPRASM
jgi:drug/metabolite transporter (DMT)-like permease